LEKLLLIQITPEDAILNLAQRLSYLNTQLRDKYASLAALCDDLEEDQAALEAIMQTVQYHYDVNRNQFIHNS